MFDFVRKHTKVMMSLMFLLLIPAFLLVGLDGFGTLGGGGATVAKVGSHKISQQEWDAAHKRQVDNIRAANPTADVNLLESPQARYATLEGMVRDRVMAQAVHSAHVVTSDVQVNRALRQSPEIAALVNPNGSIDIERLAPIAASQGLSPAGFIARVRNDLSLRKLEAGVVSTAFSTQAQTDISLNAFFEKREVQIARFNAADFASKVNPSEADIDAFYQANQTLFKAPESANVEYVVLDLDAVKKTITVSEVDLKAYYEQKVSQYGAKEERRASQILINATKAMSPQERATAKARADALLAQVRAKPSSFAELARKNSQQEETARLGGDLDYFARGAMVKPFEDAVFAMKKGDISEVVETDAGFHIILLTDIKAPKVPTFEALRKELELELRDQQAQREFSKVADSFINAVFEQPDALKPIAEKFKLDLKSVTNLQPTGVSNAPGVLANSKLLAALFDADAVDKKRNTEAVEVGPNQLASARITQYTPARTLPLAEVRANVRERLIASRSAEMAKQEGASKLAAWKSTPSAAGLPAAVTISRDAGQSIRGPLLDAALRANTASLPAWVGVDLGSQGYAVVRINKLLPRTVPDAARAQQEHNLYSQLIANAESDAYYQLLKERFKVQMKVPQPSLSATGVLP